MSSYLVESLQRYVRCVCVSCLNEECVRSCVEIEWKVSRSSVRCNFFGYFSTDSVLFEYRYMASINIVTVH